MSVEPAAALAVPGIRIADVIVGERARKDYGDLTSLVESIREHGVLQPIGVRSGGRLMFGGRRLAACKQLDLESIPVTYPTTQQDALSLLKAERDENTCRKDMTISEKVGVADQIMEMERPKARERQVAGLRQGESSPLGTTDPNGEPEPYRRSSELAAEAVGMSRKSYERAAFVTKTAENPNVPDDVRTAAQEAKARMDAGTLTITAAQGKVNAALGRSPRSAAPTDAPPPKPKSNVTPIGKGKTAAAVKARADRIRDMAGQSYTTRQIAKTLGVHEATVKKTARDYEIDIHADKVVGKTRRIDSNRIVNGVVIGLAGTCMSIDLIDYDALDKEQAAEWATSLDESFKKLNRFRKRINQIKEMAQ